jgi:hypothetical protein
MLHTRDQFDADLIHFAVPTEYMVDENRYPLPCSVCRNEFYVDEDTIRRYQRKMEYDPDDTFVCLACEQEYDEESHR